MKRLTLSDLHTHTTFSDGKDSPLDMVFSAVDKGLEVLGFSDHSYTDFDESYCMRENDCFDYIEEIDCLKNQFADDITILCGIEQDFYSTASLTGFDYVIGSVHYILPDGFSYDDGCSVLTPELLKDPLLEKKGAFIPVDETPELLMGAAKVFFDGDIYALAEKYFLTVSLVSVTFVPSSLVVTFSIFSDS